MRGPEITLWEHHAIIVYRFQQDLSYSQISTKLNIDRKAIASLVQRTTARSRSLSTDDLQEAVVVQARTGRNKRVEPGGPLSQAVRKGVQTYDHHAPDRAANHYIHQRQVLGEIDRNTRPLGTQQVHNILH
jgi:IS30 family transposase